MKYNTKKLTLTALFAAIALIIFIIEAQIPLSFSVPGLKLGLANIVTLLILFLGGSWKARDAFLVLLVRVLLAAFITGNTMSFAFSFAGGLLALGVMLAVKMALKDEAIPVVSVAGALAHNAGQIAMAALYMQSTSVFAYFPALIAGGIISGLFTGFAVYYLFKKHPKFIGFIGGKK
ncbi:MAG: Gx transporter family protein [Oscillospiraceae bacterium]|nr:Gx transporter family protein [Oscillospiraceae bacterium]